MSRSTFTTSDADSTDRRSAQDGQWLTRDSSPARAPGSRRRSVPHLALGALLVVACATGFAVTATSVDHRRTVLALAHPVVVGQVLAAADLRPVRMAAGAGVDSIPANAQSSVVGHVVALNLPAGALLTPAELGQAVEPPPGQAVIAVLVKPGQFPPDVAAGARVLLVPTSPDARARTAQDPRASVTAWMATVTAVQVLDSEQGDVVTVQAPEAQAREVAALPSGGVAMVLVSSGGR